MDFGPDFLSEEETKRRTASERVKRFVDANRNARSKYKECFFPLHQCPASSAGFCVSSFSRAFSPSLINIAALMNKPNILLISSRPKTLLLVLWLFYFSTPPDLAQAQADNSAVQNHGLPKNEVVATIPVGNSPEYAVVSPDSKTVYVSNDLSNTVSVIDASTKTVTFTIPVPDNPGSVAVTPDGRTVYVVCLDLVQLQRLIPLQTS
jgi:YVTN family beta-propeller protein